MNKKIDTVLVSGAGGFLGKKIIAQLLKEDQHKVVALSSNPEKLINEMDSFDFKAYSVEDWEFKMDFKNKEVAFVNCAFPRTSAPSYLAEGLVFTEGIVRKCMNLGVQNIINISSQSVYSQKEKGTTDERGTVSPESLYGMAKYSGERIIHALCKQYPKVNYTNIRLASLTGLEFDVRMTNRFVKKALNKETITIKGGGQHISYLDVRDAASAIKSLLNSCPDQWKPIYNLGNNESISLNELVQLIQSTSYKYSNDNLEVEYKDDESNFSNIINSDLFYNQFAWSPSYQYKNMIEELFEYYSRRV